MWAGDELSIYAVISTRNARGLGLKAFHVDMGMSGLMGDATISKAHWISDSIIGWNINAKTPGKRTLSFVVASKDDALEYRNEVDLTVAADVRLFKDRCSSAESLINTKHAAARQWFMECFRAYKAGYEAQSAAIEEQRGAERLAGQLLLGVLFAAVGGAAGGAVGQMSQLVNASKVLNEEFNSKIVGAALTDAAKDLAKYVARIPAQLATPGKHPSGGAGASTDPGAAGLAGKGAGAVAALDPLDWMTAIDGKIAGERKEIGEQIVAAQLKADEISVTNPGYIFDWDPVEVVNAGATIDGKPIDNLGPIPTALQYERACWEVWLANYAWQVRYMPGDVPGGAFHFVGSNVGGKIKDRIDKVAHQFGETANDWIDRYGAPSLAKAEAEKERLNK